MGRLISQRKNHIDQRTRFGHWEGDLIEFKGNRKQTVTTLVETKTKFLVMIKNEKKISNMVMQSIADKLLENSIANYNSITFDQGSEFARHDLIETQLKCPVFYCHPHSPWEKGINENTNGRIRYFLPKGMDINKIDQEMLDEICRVMNNTPRKCLSYRTPKELFSLHFKDVCRTWL